MSHFLKLRVIKKSNIFTQSKKVKEFEQKWSKWLGVKYSVFVNSGSSANYLTFLAIKIIYGTGEVIVPPLTWNSDINAVIQNNFKPKFVDINLNTLSMDPNKVIKNLNKNTKAVFLTHAQGFNGLTDELLKSLKDLSLEEKKTVGAQINSLRDSVDSLIKGKLLEIS